MLQTRTHNRLMVWPVPTSQPYEKAASELPGLVGFLSLSQYCPFPSASTAPSSLFLPVPLFSDKEQELGRENKPPQTTLTKIRILMERKKKFLFSISH